MLSMIQDELKIRELPARMSDPDLQPALSPVIVKANNDFPKIVTQIITAYGMSIEDFNNFHEKLDKNVIFRYKVQSEIKKIEKKAMMNKKAREASKLAEEKMAATAR